MNQLPYLNVSKPTPTNYQVTTKAHNITPLYITEYSSGFLLLLLKQPRTQHVTTITSFTGVLVDKSGQLPLLLGLSIISMN
jgi:hypothetical protein